eukprot:scaffold70378_cov61-Phaeocystis_antarctica.AAC.4
MRANQSCTESRPLPRCCRYLCSKCGSSKRGATRLRSVLNGPPPDSSGNCGGKEVRSSARRCGVASSPSTGGAAGTRFIEGS